MITRGHFIGQIIDELTGISNQVKTRSVLGLTDINRYLEDFCKDILNIILGYNLQNLNVERSNNPGIDLGDIQASIAFQITSTKTLEKIHKTLEKASPQSSIYKKLVVLVLQDKQGTYAINEELAKPFGFTVQDIWDFSDVLSRVMSLKMDRLQMLYELIKREVARVSIELEIPDSDGKYRTSLDSYIELIPVAKFLGASGYVEYCKSSNGDIVAGTEIERDFKALIKALEKLPRITRQFYALLLERGESRSSDMYINEDYLKRICRYPDMDGELRLLIDGGFCWWQEPNNVGESATFEIRFPKTVKCEYLLCDFMAFVKARQLNIENIMVGMDFTSLNESRE